MPVHVDRRKLCFRDLVLGNDERVPRTVIENARRRVRRRHTAAGAHFGGARRAFLPGRDARAAAHALSGNRSAKRRGDDDGEDGSKWSHEDPILTRTVPAILSGTSCAYNAGAPS